MISVVSLLYRLCLVVIDSYKWLEFRFLKIFTLLLKQVGKAQGEAIGIIFHCPGDDPWTEKEEKRVRAKLKKYDSLLHIKINDEVFFPRVASQGSLAVGECYMDKVWEFMGEEHDIAEFTRRCLEGGLYDLVRHPLNRFLEWVRLSAFNLQTEGRAYQVGREHYDLGNDFFELMLDPRLQYTCGYWKEASTLEEAQLHKMDLIARKLDLKPGMRVLDIGCGWGTLCKYLVENYQVDCVGLTVSKEGANYGRKICKGLPVEIRLQDYRKLTGEKFDRVVSVGMFEHVGFKNHQDYFEVVLGCLEDEGIFLLHTRGVNHANLPRSEPWLHNYILSRISVSPGQLTSHKTLSASLSSRTGTTLGWRTTPGLSAAGARDSTRPGQNWRRGMG